MSARKNKLGLLLAAGALCSGTSAWAAAASSDAPTTASPRAGAARTVFLNETGRLHLISKHGFTLNEQGSASGTIPGTIHVRLTAVSSSRVTAEVNIYVHGSSLSGHGSAAYRRSGHTASFAGSMSMGHGTGSYARAHGSNLSFSGTIAESSDAITVHVTGPISD